MDKYTAHIDVPGLETITGQLAYPFDTCSLANGSQRYQMSERLLQKKISIIVQNIKE